MLRLFLIYVLLMLLLVGVAIYQHVAAANLSLPLFPGLTLTTIILLVLAIASTVISARLAKAARPYQTLGRGLPLAQAVMTIVLATLFFSNIPPSDARDCLLSTIWQRLFSRHDAESLRRIQDAYQCCGYNTVRDRAWPFPNHQTARTCEEMYGRTLACVRPLRAALGQASGIGFGIVLMSALVQIAYMLLEDYQSSSTSAPAPSNLIGYGDATRAPLLPRAYHDTDSVSEEDPAEAREAHPAQVATREETGDAGGSPWR
ncbi:tetraspanin Tsp3 [Cordyceps militaris]|uniref:Tetraspanin Tsp3 n=1 Tax=Cordyceps militaris TaxID=73501 RepID=A0A2H4SLF7_CORMI|nr:tetraspanin Tsp3 [Cordyceps militaris]